MTTAFRRKMDDDAYSDIWYAYRDRKHTVHGKCYLYQECTIFGSMSQRGRAGITERSRRTFGLMDGCSVSWPNINDKLVEVWDDDGLS